MGGSRLSGPVLFQCMDFTVLEGHGKMTSFANLLFVLECLIAIFSDTVAKKTY